LASSTRSSRRFTILALFTVPLLLGGLSPHQWAQKLERLFTPVWQVCRVSRMVASATRWGRPFASSLTACGSCVMAAGSARDASLPLRTAQPLSLPPSATGLSRFFRDTLGASLVYVSIAPIV